MEKKERWLSKFEELEPEEQLEVADFIREELDLNVEIAEDEGEEYNILYSRKEEDFFEKFIYSLKANNIAKKNLDTLKKFDSLNEKNKKKVILELSKIISKYLYLEEIDNKKKICSNEGHDFTKWTTNKWTTSEYFMEDHREHDVEHIAWIRSCKRCGYVESVEEEPQELIDARNEKEKQIKIKELKQELKKLEGK